MTEDWAPLCVLLVISSVSPDGRWVLPPLGPCMSCAQLAIVLASVTHLCCLSMSAFDISAVQLCLCQSRVSSEVRCSRRVICPLESHSISQSYKYTPRVSAFKLGEGNLWGSRRGLQPLYWWWKHKLGFCLCSLGNKHTPSYPSSYHIDEGFL